MSTGPEEGTYAPESSPRPRAARSSLETNRLPARFEGPSWKMQIKPSSGSLRDWLLILPISLVKKKKTEREILRETQATLSKLAIQRG